MTTRTRAAKTGDEKAKPRLEVASPDAHAEALEQADEYDSLFGTTPLTLNDGTVMDIPPHPDYGMLDDPKLEEWDQLKFDVNNLYDRTPDTYVPEQKIYDEHGNVTTILPADTIKGTIIQPYQVTGADGRAQLIKPPHQIRIVQIALGAEGYKQLREGGKNASDVLEIWGRQSIRIRDRANQDSKSAGSTVDLASVPASDS